MAGIKLRTRSFLILAFIVLNISSSAFSFLINNGSVYLKVPSLGNVNISGDVHLSSKILTQDGRWVSYIDRNIEANSLINNLKNGLLVYSGSSKPYKAMVIINYENLSSNDYTEFYTLFSTVPGAITAPDRIAFVSATLEVLTSTSAPSIAFTINATTATTLENDITFLPKDTYKVIQNTPSLEVKVKKSYFAILGRTSSFADVWGFLTGIYTVLTGAGGAATITQDIIRDAINERNAMYNNGWCVEDSQINLKVEAIFKNSQFFKDRTHIRKYFNHHISIETSKEGDEIIAKVKLNDDPITTARLSDSRRRILIMKAMALEKVYVIIKTKFPYLFDLASAGKPLIKNADLETIDRSANKIVYKISNTIRPGASKYKVENDNENSKVTIKLKLADEFMKYPTNSPVEFYIKFKISEVNIYVEKRGDDDARLRFEESRDTKYITTPPFGFLILDITPPLMMGDSRPSNGGNPYTYKEIMPSGDIIPITLFVTDANRYTEDEQLNCDVLSFFVSPHNSGAVPLIWEEDRSFDISPVNSERGSLKVKSLFTTLMAPSSCGDTNFYIYLLAYDYGIRGSKDRILDQLGRPSDVFEKIYGYKLPINNTLKSQIKGNISFRIKESEIFTDRYEFNTVKSKVLPFYFPRAFQVISLDNDRPNIIANLYRMLRKDFSRNIVRANLIASFKAAEDYTIPDVWFYSFKQALDNIKNSVNSISSNIDRLLEAYYQEENDNPFKIMFNLIDSSNNRSMIKQLTQIFISSNSLPYVSAHQMNKIKTILNDMLGNNWRDIILREAANNEKEASYEFEIYTKIPYLLTIVPYDNSQDPSNAGIKELKIYVNNSAPSIVRTTPFKLKVNFGEFDPIQNSALKSGMIKLRFLPNSLFTGAILKGIENIDQIEGTSGVKLTDLTPELPIFASVEGKIIALEFIFWDKMAGQSLPLIIETKDLNGFKRRLKITLNIRKAKLSAKASGKSMFKVFSASNTNISRFIRRRSINLISPSPTAPSPVRPTPRSRIEMR